VKGNIAVELQPYGSTNLDGYCIHPNFYYRRAVVLQLRKVKIIFITKKHFTKYKESGGFCISDCIDICFKEFG
jgi:hypothetical protein